MGNVNSSEDLKPSGGLAVRSTSVCKESAATARTKALSSFNNGCRAKECSALGRHSRNTAGVAVEARVEAEPGAHAKQAVHFLISPRQICSPRPLE